MPPKCLKKPRVHPSVKQCDLRHSLLVSVSLGSIGLDKRTSRFKDFPDASNEATLSVGKDFTTFEMLLCSSLFHLKLPWGGGAQPNLSAANNVLYLESGELSEQPALVLGAEGSP